MQLTPDQLKQNAAAMIAFAEGKPIQRKRTDGVWYDESNIAGMDWLPFRPKPEPKTRPWSKPDDVPGPVCWIRGSSEDSKSAYLVTCIVHDGISYGLREETAFRTWDMLRRYCEYSTDRKTWHKCEVTE